MHIGEYALPLLAGMQYCTQRVVHAGPSNSSPHSYAQDCHECSALPAGPKRLASAPAQHVLTIPASCICYQALLVQQPTTCLLHHVRSSQSLLSHCGGSEACQDRRMHACRPFDTSKAETLINGFTNTMTTVSPANINVLNIAKVCWGCSSIEIGHSTPACLLAWKGDAPALKLAHSKPYSTAACTSRVAARADFCSPHHVPLFFRSLAVALLPSFLNLPSIHSVHACRLWQPGGSCSPRQTPLQWSRCR